MVPSQTNRFGRQSIARLELRGEARAHPASSRRRPPTHQIGTAPRGTDRSTSVEKRDVDAQAARARCRMLEQRLPRRGPRSRGRSRSGPRPGSGSRCRPSGRTPAVIASLARGIGVRRVVERRVGEHDAEAERVVGAVALDDGDPCRGSARFIRIAKYRPAGPPPMHAIFTRVIVPTRAARASAAGRARSARSARIGGGAGSPPPAPPARRAGRAARPAPPHE